MISIPDSAFVYRLLACDNGSDTFGVSFVEVDLRTGHLHVSHSETCTASRSLFRYEGMADERGAFAARLCVLRGFFQEILHDFDPHGVVVEGPFVHLNVSTYMTLKTVINALRDEVYDYNPALVVDEVAPMSAKKAVKAKEYTGKEPVRDAVLALTHVTYAPQVDRFALDEHCIDSIAVAAFQAERLLRQVHRR